MLRHLAIIPLAFLLLPAAAVADCRTIDRLPTEIRDPGCHRLTTSAELQLASGAAIRILADDVVLDLDGHGIVNTQGSSNTAVGVMAYERSNIVVRNGSIRGFQTGVALGVSTPAGWSFGGYTVENLQLYGSTLFGIDVRGFGLTVRGNRVARTGGSSARGRIGEGHAIYAQGNLVSIVDNDVLGVTGNSSDTWGITVAGTNTAVVERNRVMSTGFGIVVDQSAPSGTCRDNSFGEIAIASYDCPIDGGGNSGEIRNR